MKIFFFQGRPLIWSFYWENGGFLPRRWARWMYIESIMAGSNDPSLLAWSSNKVMGVLNWNKSWVMVGKPTHLRASGTGQMEAFAKAKPSCFEGPGTDRSRPVRPNTLKNKRKNCIELHRIATVSCIDFGTFWDHIWNSGRWMSVELTVICHPIRKSMSYWFNGWWRDSLDLNASGRDYAQGALWKHGEVQPLAS